MSNEVLIAIVAINAVVTLSLWRMMATKANRPAGLNKKAAKALWHSDPIVPRHDPPKAVGGDFPSLVHDADRTFFDDFEEFADVVNWWLADKYVGSRFRLQDLPDGNVRLKIHFDSGPVAGWCFAVYYNQTRIGRLEIHPILGEYTTQTPYVYTSVQIDWPRFLRYRTITEFLDIIASHVADPKPKSDEYVSARQRIQAALTEMLWNNYGISEFDRVFASEEDMDWGELNVSFHGAAEWYFTRRNAWQKTAATNKVEAERADRAAMIESPSHGWSPVWAMPNVTLDDAINASHVALAPSHDQRVLEFAKRASKSLRDLRVAEVLEQDLVIEKGKVEAYRTKLKVSFKYEGKD